MKSLHRKIEVSYLVLVGITVAISTFSAYHFSKLGNATRALLLENYRSVQAAEGMVKALERQENAQLRMLVGDYEGGRNAFQAGKEEFFTAYEQSDDNVRDERAAQLLNDVAERFELYSDASDRLHALLAVNRFDPGMLPLRRELIARAADLRASSIRLLEYHQGVMVRKQEDVEQLAEAATKAVVVASVLAVVLSLVASLRFVRHIVRPIEHLTDSVRRIGRGLLSEKIDISTEDEIAELSREFNKMTERLSAFESMNVQKLIAEKKKSESLVAALPNPVIMMDELERVLLLNQAATDVLDVRSGEWQERPLTEIAGNHTLTRYLDGGTPADEGPDPVLRVPTDAGTRYYRRRQVVMENPEGHVELKVVMLEDVTHFKELDQLKSDFLAAVSHELRTPLTSLGMAVDLLQQGIPGSLNELQRDLLQTIDEDNERLKKFVEALLHLARLEAGMYQPERTVVDLESMVQQAVGALRLPFAAAGVRLNVELPPQLPPVWGDPQQLGWVVTNLVGNALRHTPEDGEVRVSAFVDGTMLHACVADTGSGIPREALEIIFDKFVQVKGTTAPGSAGLGLAISKAVIDSHGGRIWAESELSKGAEFHFTVPLYGGDTGAGEPL